MNPSSESIDSGVLDVFTPPTYNTHQGRLNNGNNFITTGAISPSPNEGIYLKNIVSSPSISLSRRRKEAAEEKLISLFSAATKSFDSKPSIPGSLVGNINSMSSDESSERGDELKVSGSMDHTISTNMNRNKVMRPVPRRPNFHTPNSSGVFTDIANLDALVPDDSRRVHGTDGFNEYHTTRKHYSEQMNIQVMENFFVFQV
jgi:hypothetical protein